MANDRDNSRDQKDETSKHDRVIGRGMTSPDSTQVPLRTSDGEPDLDAINGRVPSDMRDENTDDERK